MYLEFTIEKHFCARLSEYISRYKKECWLQGTITILYCNFLGTEKKSLNIHALNYCYYFKHDSSSGVNSWSRVTVRFLGFILVQLRLPNIEKCIELKFLKRIWFILCPNEITNMEETICPAGGKRPVHKKNSLGICCIFNFK